MKKLTKILLDKSHESFLLALELFNKPTSGYRVESFCLLFSNAWELALKAYIFESNNGSKKSIFMKKKRRERRKTITLDQSLSNVFEENNPVRKNIEFVSELRNEAAHLIIEEMEPYFSRVFQSGVINYIEFINEKFSIDIIERLNPGFISLVSQEKDIKNIGLLKQKLAKEDLNNIKSWLDRFQELENMGHKAAIPLTYKVAIVNNPEHADITLSNSKVGNAGNVMAGIIIEKTKDRDLTHPHTANEALAEVNRRLNISPALSSYDFQAYCYYKNVKKTKKNDLFWHAKHSTPTYSDKFIDQMTNYFTEHSDQRNTMRSKYKSYLRSKNPRKK